jgi:glycerophosphoryl diester phosphodiesterase
MTNLDTVSAQTAIDSMATVTELEGYASLPADSFAEGPPTGTGIDANGRTGPFEGPPVQGFSAVQFAPEGDGSTYWFLSDNGFGTKANSADYLLRIYQVDPNFAGSEAGDANVEVQGFVQLSDPNGLIPFDIQHEGTSERNLTGSDFDVESFVIDSQGDIWIGEEFGPYVLHFDSTGKLLEAPIVTPNENNFNSLNGQTPIVIGHRGASGERPEHTLAAYELAIAQGADFIEPDLVTTKDHVLVARHENEISSTTDVADRPEFADRQTTKVVDGAELTGWFVEDFTLTELKTLRAKERIPEVRPDNTEFDGQFEVPTLTEIIDLVKRVEAETGKQIGIYPETKHPTFLAKEGSFLDGTPIGIDTSQILVDTLIANDFTDPNRIFLQSFEVQNLIEIQARLTAEGIGDIPLVQLYGDTTAGADPADAFSYPYDIRYNVAQGNDLAAIYSEAFLAAAENPLSENTLYADLDGAEILQVIREQYAEGAGPWKNNILLREALETPVDGNGDGVAEITTQLTGEVTSFIEDAHAAGLQVHPYTLRQEESFLTLNADGTPQTLETEIAQMVQIGADGFFIDFPGVGADVIDTITAEIVRSPDNPDVIAGETTANLLRSRGFEGMAFSPDRQTLYPMLEGSVLGDAAGALRIYEFDVAAGEFDGLLGYYSMESPDHAIGDFAPINDHEFLVIERDNNQGEAAEFKQIFKVNLSELDSDGFVKKEALVDLLNIGDAADLNGDGSPTFDFPFITIESVLALDEDTLLVANDNNYPFSLGRDPVEIDNNEIIQITLDQPLALDQRLGAAALNRTILQGDSTTDQLVADSGDEFIFGGDGNDRLAGGLGSDQIFGEGGDDQLSGDLYNRSSQGSIGGDDILFGGAGNDSLSGKGGSDRLLGEAGDDLITGDDGDDLLRGGLGNDTLTGNQGSDTFVLALGDGLDTIQDFEVGEDLIGLAEGLAFGSLSISIQGDNTLISDGGEILAGLVGVSNLSESAFVTV